MIDFYENPIKVNILWFIPVIFIVLITIGILGVQKGHLRRDMRELKKKNIELSIDIEVFRQSWVVGMSKLERVHRAYGDSVPVLPRQK